MFVSCTSVRPGGSRGTWRASVELRNDIGEWITIHDVLATVRPEGTSVRMPHIDYTHRDPAVAISISPALYADLTAVVLAGISDYEQRAYRERAARRGETVA